MREIIKRVPIPAAGVALGLAALGNLLQPYSEVVRAGCGLLSAAFVALLVAKIVLYPRLIQGDMRNSILASVSATLFMALMQLATYLAPIAVGAAFALWLAAIIGHLGLMGWFTFAFIRRFRLEEVFPTYFICYVGIIVASATSPVFSLKAVGYGLFWFGFACYAALLVVVTARYLRHPAPEATRPLLCIYSAPMSLSIVGYLACAPDPHPAFVAALLVLAQALFAVVLTRVPGLVRLPFYPSFAAMTFPFVITATALCQSLAFLRGAGWELPWGLDVLALCEMAFAVGMVAFATIHYVRFLFLQPRSQSEPATEPVRLAGEELG